MDELIKDFKAGNYGNTILSSVGIVKDQHDTEGLHVLEDGVATVLALKHLYKRWGAPAGGRQSAVGCWFEAALGAPRRIHGDLLNMRVAGKMGQTKLALRAGPEHSDIPEARSTSAAGVETCSDSSKKGFRV